MFATLGLIPAAARLLRGQQQDPATFSTGVKVVNLFANVRNKKGEIVRDLTKDDFLLDEEGRPQTIGYFSQESDLPLTLGLMVDTSGSQRNLIDQERAASYRFFEQVLRPEKDVAFVIHFDFEAELLQDITSSRRLLEQALEDLSTPSRLRQRGQQGGGGQQGRYPGGGGGRYPGGGGGRYPGGGGGAGGTVLYDSVLLASDEIMRKQAGRKALILLTDGDDHGSKVSLSAAVESAQRADALVYSVLFADRENSIVSFGGMGRNRGTRRRRHAQQWQEGSGTYFQRDRRPVLRGVQKSAPGQNLQRDRGRPAPPVQPRLHAQRKSQPATTASISPPNKKT